MLVLVIIVGVLVALCLLACCGYCMMADDRKQRQSIGDLFEDDPEPEVDDGGPLGCSRSGSRQPCTARCWCCPLVRPSTCRFDVGRCPIYPH